MSKNLIIGGSGFVGNALITLLGKDNCFNIDKRPSKLYPDITCICDIRNPIDIYFNTKIQNIILLAAEHRDDVSPISLYYDVNVNGTINVLNYMDKHNIENLIFLSSVAVYGLNINYPNELSTPKPFNHYGKSKLQAENEIIKWFSNNANQKNITIIRPTVIFGEGNRGNVYNLIKQILDNKMIQIGNGLNYKSIAYIGNVVDFISYNINYSDLGLKIFNYSDTPDYNMNEFVNIVNELAKRKKRYFKISYNFAILIGYFFDMLSFLTNKKFNISSIRIKKYCANTQIDSNKAFVNFKPKYTLKEGLYNMISSDFKDKII
jgi:nucleoside-diphosphate-sugar epimerase